MSVVPNIETLSLIAGVGGWSGVYHGVALYLDDTPTTPLKIAKMALLPLFWGSAGITGFMTLWLTFQSSIYIAGNMLRPLPFTIHMLVLCGIFCAYAARKQVREFLFVTPAEQAVAEQAQDREEADATQAGTEATQSEADGEDADNEAEAEAESDDDSSTVTDIAPIPLERQVDRMTTELDEADISEPEDDSEQPSTLATEVDRLMDAVPVTPPRSATPVLTEPSVSNNESQA